MKLTQEQIDFFWQNGYLKYGSLLTTEEIELYRREYDRLFAEAKAEGTAYNLAQAAKPGETSSTSKQQMYQISRVCERNVVFAKLNYDARILDIVEDLIGPNIMLFHDQALYKPAHTGGAVYWHQDNAYWKCRPATLLSCWLTLDDATKENGAMQVIPGSHLKPVWHDPTQTAVLVETKVDDSQAVVVDIPAGGVMFHHCQTLHYTQPNETDRQRRAYAIHFMPPGTRDLKGNVMPVGFGHPMLRARV